MGDELGTMGVEESGDEGGIGVADLAWGRGGGGIDEFVAGDAMEDARAWENRGMGDADLGEEGDFGGAEERAWVEEEIALAGLFALVADKGLGGGGEDGHGGVVELDIFLGDDASRAVGDEGTGEDSGGFAVVEIEGRFLAGLDFSDDGEVGRGVIEGEGIAVHGGAAVGGEIGICSGWGVEDEAEGVVEGESGGRKRRGIFENQLASGGERNHGKKF